MRSWTTELPSRFLPGRRPRLIAHRGLATDGAENTLRAFSDALAAGATMLETDTRATADGVALAMHDADLRRVAGDERSVRQLRVSDLPGVRIGGADPVATLAEVLSAFPEVPINIDVKDARAIEPAVDAIAETRATERVCVTSFDGGVARRAVELLVRRTGHTPMRSPSRGVIGAVWAASALEAPAALTRTLLRPYGALQVPPVYRGVPVITPRMIARAHRAGCEVHAWTIDDAQQMRALLAAGVDGIITNRVDLLYGVLNGQA